MKSDNPNPATLSRVRIKYKLIHKNSKSNWRTPTIVGNEHVKTLKNPPHLLNVLGVLFIKKPKEIDEGKKNQWKSCNCEIV